MYFDFLMIYFSSTLKICLLTTGYFMFTHVQKQTQQYLTQRAFWVKSEVNLDNAGNILVFVTKSINTNKQLQCEKHTNYRKMPIT